MLQQWPAIQHLREHHRCIHKFLQEQHKKQANLHNMQVDTLMNALIAYEAGLDNVPEQYRSKVYSKAWSTGHSSGHYAVYQELSELVKIFK